MPGQGAGLARTPEARPAQLGQDTDRADRDNWQVILDQLEGDVSRAEQLTVGARLVGNQDRPEPDSGDASVEDELSDELLAARSVPLPAEPAWEPHPGHPPMPAEYAERARVLLDRQIAIAAHIAREIALGRQQAAYASHIGELEEVHAAPAFIDEAI